MATSNQTESMNRPLVILMISWLAIVCALGVGWWFTAEQDGRGITADNAAKIVNGMTQREVSMILGCEPGWYYGRDNKYHFIFYNRSHRPTPVLWMSSPNGIVVAVYFQEDAVYRVEVLQSTPNHDAEPKQWPTEFSMIP